MSDVEEPEDVDVFEWLKERMREELDKEKEARATRWNIGGMMKAMLLDGPNQGVIHVDKEGNTLKVLDPSERVVSYSVRIKDPDVPIKIHTYYRIPLNPFAAAHGIDVLYRWSKTY